jgi:hypothetical protein
MMFCADSRPVIGNFQPHRFIPTSQADIYTFLAMMQIVFDQITGNLPEFDQVAILSSTGS